MLVTVTGTDKFVSHKDIAIVLISAYFYVSVIFSLYISIFVVFSLSILIVAISIHTP